MSWCDMGEKTEQIYTGVLYRSRIFWARGRRDKYDVGRGRRRVGTDTRYGTLNEEEELAQTGGNEKSLRLCVFLVCDPKDEKW